MNSNNATAKYYNQVYKFLKPDSLTESEISLITNLVPPKSKILDIGAGTGRHSLILADLNYIVTAIDSSKEMLNQIKHTNVKVINQDIFKFKKNENFDLVCMFWNTFNEICLTKKSYINLLKILKRLISKDGYILINVDNANLVNPSNFDFSIEFNLNDLHFKQNWKTEKFFKRTNTSICKEEIFVFKDKKLIDKKIAHITQRYWNLNDLKKIFNLQGFKVKELFLKQSKEVYILLTM